MANMPDHIKPSNIGGNPEGQNRGMEAVMKTHFLAYFTVLLLVLASCKEGAVEIENTDPVPVPYEVFGAVQSVNPDFAGTCRLNPHNLDVRQNITGLSDVELIINTLDSFETYIRCQEKTDEPDIDSTVVLAGLTTGQPHCIYVKEIDVYLLKGVLVYEVIIGDMACQMPDRAQYIVGIPKNYSVYPVEFTIVKEE
jgi:hypothetical protein